MANLGGIYLPGRNLEKVYPKGAYFGVASLIGVNLQEADLEGVFDLSLDQLSEVKTLYSAKIDKELFTPLKEKYPALFEKDG